MYDLEDDRSNFYDPGNPNSALRAGKRDKPCPQCGKKNRLTAEDVRRRYICDPCADAAERGVDY